MRQREYFFAYHVWRSAFDALSSACGAGLLVGDLHEDYSPTGRGVLLLMGALGAVAWLRAFLAAWAQLAGSHHDRTTGTFAALLTNLASWSLTRWLLIVLLPAIAAGTIVAGVDVLTHRPAPALESFYQGAAAWISLGWNTPVNAGPQRFILGVIGLISGLGLPVLILALRQQPAALRGCVKAVAAYLLLLAGAAALITAYETPRGRGGGDGGRLNDLPVAQRLLRAANLAAAVSAAGLATEPLADRQASEGTHAVVAALLLIGPLPTSPGGGLKVTLLWAALAGVLATIGLAPAARDDPRRRLRHAAITLLVWLGLATVVTALGLLLIETLTASRFTPPPALSDALLDAASAVCGGGISGGLTHAVTNEQLTHGIRLPVDLYPYGMSWLMLAMLTGRLLPVLVLLRCAARKAEAVA